MHVELCVIAHKQRWRPCECRHQVRAVCMHLCVDVLYRRAETKMHAFPSMPFGALYMRETIEP